MEQNEMEANGASADAVRAMIEAEGVCFADFEAYCEAMLDAFYTKGGAVWAGSEGWV